MNIKTVSFLIQLKNASLISQELIKVDSNKFIKRILKKLYDEGYILSYRINRKANFHNGTSEATVHLRYLNQDPVLANLKICSTPAHNMTLKWNEICRLNIKTKLFIFSTNLGLLSLKECQKKRVGGVLLFTS